MSDDFLGRAVVDGRVRFLSVSSLEKADHSTPSGCLRRWFYRYIGGKSAEEAGQHDAAKQAGVDLHAEIARYLKTGEKVLSTLASRGLHMMPDPGPDLIVEHKIHTVDKMTIASALTAADIPVVGYIDCGHDRGTNKGADDVGEPDPPGTVELIDWKRKGNAKDRDGRSTLLRPTNLIGTIQMAGYGEWVRRVMPYRSHVRLSLGYFPAKGGQPCKVTRLHPVGDFVPAWNRVEAVARTIVQAATETVAERVAPNVNACDVYGGCPHRGYCQAYKSIQDISLSNLFGETASQELKVGLLQQLEQANTTPTVVPTIPDTRATLAAEEKAERARQAALQANSAQAFAASWNAIQSHGQGFPALGGAAAQMYSSIFGTAPPASGFAGAGRLGAIVLQDPAHVSQLAGELAEAPAALAPVASAAAVVTQSILPPDAPPSRPELAATPLVPQDANAAPDPTKEAPKRKRRTKAEIAADFAAMMPTQSTTTTATGMVVTTYDPPSLPAVTSTTTVDLEVFVDCMPLDLEFRQLSHYADQLCGVLAARYCVDDKGAKTMQDIRCAPEKSVLGFGRWKGALHALVRECPPEDATYFGDTRGNEIMEVVADAMRQHCMSRGALYVRGLR